MRMLIAMFAGGLVLAHGCGKSREPDAVWCSTGMGPGQVVYPRAITYHAALDGFFVIDRAAHVQWLDSAGQCKAEWLMPEWKLGKPVGLSVGPDGNLYIADTHYSRVMVYTPQGKLLGQWGAYGQGPGQFIWPTDVAFDAQGNIYVAEYGGNDRIQVFAPADVTRDQPKYLREFGKPGNGPGELARPQSILIEDQTMYIADSSNHRIAVFNIDGQFVRDMGGVGSEPGQYRFPYGLDIDGEGRLVVCEYGNNRVQLIDKQTGKGLKIWGEPGREAGQLAYPWAVAVDKRGRAVVVDSGNNRLQVFSF